MALRRLTERELELVWERMRAMDGRAFDSLSQAIWIRNETLCDCTADIFDRALMQAGITRKQADYILAMHNTIVLYVLYVLDDGVPQKVGRVH